MNATSHSRNPARAGSPDRPLSNRWPPRKIPAPGPLQADIILLGGRAGLDGIKTKRAPAPPGSAGDRISGLSHQVTVKLLPAGSTVVIKSHKCKTDIHGRFVADVFYKEGIEEADEIIKEAVYLNQQLLD